MATERTSGFQTSRTATHDTLWSFLFYIFYMWGAGVLGEWSSWTLLSFVQYIIHLQEYNTSSELKIEHSIHIKICQELHFMDIFEMVRGFFFK